jgi:TPP-dependent pyruvate/acetoin dehydrogenase alpha subunit
MGTALERHQAQTDISRKADSYDLSSSAVDGMDILAVEAAAKQAADFVRSGNGPFLLELRTYRFRAHSMADPDLYRTKQEIEQWRKRDPIVLFESKLRESGLLTDSDIARIESEISAEIDEAVQFAEASPREPVEDLLKDVQGQAAP